MTDNESDEGRAEFLRLVQQVDPHVQVVIPTAPSNSLYLISLTKGQSRKFVSIPEDDLLDLSEQADVRRKVATVVREAIAAL
ncbi:MAG: hypothetical protein U0172_05180 [Nitrospiraceae bacterium]